jgi:hypothetical protein
MADTYVLPALPERFFAARRNSQFMSGATLVGFGTIATGTFMAALVGSALTWMHGTHRPADVATKVGATMSAVMPQKSPDGAPASPDFSQRAKTALTFEDRFAVQTDPTLSPDTAYVWSPAGGLSTLFVRSVAPADRLAALPMPAPIVAARNAPPQTQAQREADLVPMPRAHPGGATPLAKGSVRPIPVPAQPEQTPQTAEQKPASTGFFGFLSHIFTPAEKPNVKALFAANPKAAVYDIAAHVVYLPNGEALEAHSGYGQWLDDPQSYARKDRGVTPPNVYKLTLREKLFHGVKALRLVPVGEEAKMYGRDGMLAHTYMLGPNGQSNGCVSFKNYTKFLQAFASGEVDQLIVLPRVPAAPVAPAATTVAQAG